MRYNKRVTFHKTLDRQYNPDTSKTEVIIDSGVTLPCIVTGVSLEKAATVFGSVDREVATVKLQRPYKGYADKAVINKEKYNVLRNLTPRSESIFYLEKVSEWT